jgi:uncharacterized membrane protein (UPF0136 family)
MNDATVLWIYIALLVVGGLIGFLKGKSKISLNMSLGFAVALAVCNINGFLDANLARTIAEVLLVLLLVVFGIRLAKTKKFMPAGMMLVITLATLFVRHLN